MYRNIIEMSPMKNNMEAVIYTEREIKRGEELPVKHSFYSPHLVLSRKVYDAEISLGIDVSYRGDKYEENPPELTLLLDAFYSYKCMVELYNIVKEENPKITPSHILATVIGGNYYDCMSSGANRYDMIIWHYICRHHPVDQNEKVYPGKNRESGGDEWYTIKDFLEATPHIPELTEILKKFRVRLPDIRPLLTE